MSDIAKPMPVASSGSQKPTPAHLEIWEIAVLPICRRGDGALVDVEHVTDEEFERFVQASAIPIIDGGIVFWNFWDRCGAINYALRRGIKPRLVGPLPNYLANYSELFVITEKEEKGEQGTS
ncbi:MAG: hypothetical protein H0W02_18785 [Ktedonobacteraceae bacterium]|nr:hypothetical protein [Ktedonobacteraceae bacterium]